MKANELMIGDWVKVLPISRKVEAHYSKVGALTRNVDNTISIEGGYFPEWKGWSVGEDDIEPIPLTLEMLYKNRFDKVDDAISSKWSMVFDVDVIHYKYVHELQHALRLCGLNELANNFKVN